ncbi:MAG: AraC family ligand binding domain-containing protein [Flavobacteriales bacterium]|nr:AraC family ligand binding domain-containing protein [Flavobacteriales bacterium]
MDRCPYCESARSLLLGQGVLFPPCWSADMRSLKTGTLYIRSRRLEESADHVSRLSIRCMLNGQQWYKVGGTDRVVNPDNFLVIDQGQHYRTAFHGDAEQEMLMVGFRPGFAAEGLRTLTHTTEQLLDDPGRIGRNPPSPSRPTRWTPW